MTTVVLVITTGRPIPVKPVRLCVFAISCREHKCPENRTYAKKSVHDTSPQLSHRFVFFTFSAKMFNLALHIMMCYSSERVINVIAVSEVFSTFLMCLPIFPYLQKRASCGPLMLIRVSACSFSSNNEPV